MTARLAHFFLPGLSIGLLCIACDLSPEVTEQKPGDAAVFDRHADSGAVELTGDEAGPSDLEPVEQGGADHFDLGDGPVDAQVLADASQTDLESADRALADLDLSDLANISADAAQGDSFFADAGAYQRESLASCWTDPLCPRVMAVGHGGLWSLSDVPYDSNAAIAAAWQEGMDGVKIDVRVTVDDVPVISHSSPLEIWESLDCYNQKIEEMTVAEVTACHRLPGGEETFQRLDDVLEYIRGKMVVQLCVKESRDFARTIAQIHRQAAEDFAFIELSPGELLDLIPSLAGSDSVYYLVNVADDLSAVDALLGDAQNPQAFMFEFDPDVDMGDLVATRLHPAGVRSFSYLSTQTATVAQLQALFEQGHDVVSANAGANAVQARININQERAVSPP